MDLSKLPSLAVLGALCGALLVSGGCDRPADSSMEKPAEATPADNERAAEADPAAEVATPTQATATITGSFGYRERIGLPPGAKGVVKLEDTSRADAAATVLAVQTIPLDRGSVPVAFELKVDAAKLDPSLQYTVRAEIRGPDDALLFTTDTANPIDPKAETQALPPITLIQAAASAADSGGGAGGLVGPAWRVEDLNGGGVIDDSQTSIEFNAEGRVSGIAGCNRYSADYTTREGTLSFGEAAVTRRACAPAVGDQEKKFLELFGAIDRYTFDGDGSLLLKTADGRTIRARR